MDESLPAQRLERCLERLRLTSEDLRMIGASDAVTRASLALAEAELAHLMVVVRQVHERQKTSPHP